MISTSFCADGGTVDLNARIGDVLVTATVHLEPTESVRYRVEREVTVFIGKLRTTQRIKTPKYVLQEDARSVIGQELQRIVDDISWRDA